MKLDKTLVVLDLETTGIGIEKDRIIEIAMIQCQPDGQKETYLKRVNPEMPIPDVVAKLTGITNDDLKDEPVFKDIAENVLSFIGDADLAGFNIERFDLPLLEKELGRAGLPFSYEGRHIYDAMTIYKMHEKRDLAAAYKFYCDKEITNAHSAMADSSATLEVLASQVEKYGNSQDGVESLKQFAYKKSSNAANRLEQKNGEYYLAFGKHSGKSLKEMAQNNPGYLEWILKKDFEDDIKDIIKGVLAETKVTRPVL